MTRKKSSKKSLPEVEMPPDVFQDKVTKYVQIVLHPEYTPYEKFIFRCVEILPQLAYKWIDGQYPPKRNSTAALRKEPLEITQEWSIGGQGGGSCWDSEERPDRHYAITGDPAPSSFTELDRLLLGLCPDISFLRYRDLCSDVVEETTRHENNYYGNHTDYAVRKVSLRKLFDYLNLHGLLGSNP